MACAPTRQRGSWSIYHNAQGERLSQPIDLVSRQVASRMFLHFFHDQIVKTAQQAELYRGREPLLDARLRSATIQAAAFGPDRPLLVPTIDLVQSPYLERADSVIRPLAAEGHLEFVGSTVVLEVLEDQKMRQFTGTGLHPQWGSESARGRLKRFEDHLRARGTHTRADLTDRWYADVAALDASEPEGEPARRFRQARLLLPAKPSARELQNALAKIPGRLDERAFLWDVFEAGGLLDLGPAGAAQPLFERGMAYNWILSHLEEYDTRIIGGIPGLSAIDFGLSRTHPDRVVDLDSYSRAFSILEMGTVLGSLTVEDAMSLRMDLGWQTFLDHVINPLVNDLQHGIDPAEATLYRQVRSIAHDAGDVGEGMAALHPVLRQFEQLPDVPLPSALGGPMDEARARVVVRLGGTCPEYRDEVRRRFDELLDQILAFLQSRMGMTPTRAGSRCSYLFDPSATEQDLQRDLDDFLTGNLADPLIEYELGSLAGGRGDLVVHYGGWRFTLELKCVKRDASPEGLRRFLPQAVTYTAADTTLGFLVVLDLTPEREPQSFIQDNIWVEEVPPQRSGDRSRFIVTLRVPGNRSAPSSL